MSGLPGVVRTAFGRTCGQGSLGGAHGAACPAAAPAARRFWHTRCPAMQTQKAVHSYPEIRPAPPHNSPQNQPVIHSNERVIHMAFLAGFAGISHNFGNCPSLSLKIMEI